MAATKLTLSSDKQTVELAKRIASEDNISVSKLFKQLLNDFSKKRKKEDPLLEKYKAMEIPEELKALRGILKGKVADDVDYKDLKWEYLKERHGL
ncbi:hypothetical protein FPZ42_18025 [Mucilaginibacter achroorhodeus]|jgi:Family of unknown function (DUF6364)|uniref:Uncharacterized protein n=1 Tax=Mucilaginibacter achroorhodeus TaxID=2599294 RepID=A0A563TX16_9SPHI|nr:DUF6364 family protein [Mucilaginibacter achroorhodeus]TWR23907.1 hypothetical protein FPZ42_18025 [Mucilaginibacter achroorhodeus]